MKSTPVCFSAIVALILPLTTFAAGSLDSARSEMESALGTVPPFIDLLSEGSQAGAWALMKGSSELCPETFTF